MTSVQDVAVLNGNRHMLLPVSNGSLSSAPSKIQHDEPRSSNIRCWPIKNWTNWTSYFELVLRNSKRKVLVIRRLKMKVEENGGLLSTLWSLREQGRHPCKPQISSSLEAEILEVNSAHRVCRYYHNPHMCYWECFAQHIYALETCAFGSANPEILIIGVTRRTHFNHWVLKY